MFAPHCTTCGGRVLLGTRRIIGIHDDGAGHRHITLRCHCGATVRDRLTGPGRHRAVA
jgi:hypothetical protein